MASNVPAAFLRSASPEDALKAFNDSLEEAAEAAEAVAQTDKAKDREGRNYLKGLKRVNQYIGKSITGAVNSGPAGVLAQATQAGIQSQFTGNNTTFGQGFTSSLVRGAASVSGLNQLEISAIDRAAQRTQDFFSPAAEAGIDFTSPAAQAQVNRINQIFQDQEDRKIPLQRQLTDITNARVLHRGGHTFGEATDQIVALLTEIRDKFPRTG